MRILLRDVPYLAIGKNGTRYHWNLRCGQNGPTIILYMNSKNFTSPIKKVSKRPKVVKGYPAKNKPVPPLTTLQKGMIDGNFSLMHPIFENKVPPAIAALINTFITSVVRAHNHYILHQGVAFGTKYWKEITAYCTSVCEGRETEKVHRLATGRVDGWPTRLTELRPLFHYIIDVTKPHHFRAECLRLLLTLFKLNKVCSDYKEIDISDIDSSFKLNPETISGFNAYLSKVFPVTQEDRLKNLAELRSDSFVFGPANGPNSVPKAESALAEAKLLLDGDLTEPFTDYCNLTSNTQLLSYMENYIKLGIEEPKSNRVAIRKDITLRKLQAIASNGNKSRTIAICDFWTQTLLAPLEHKEQNDMVRRFAGRSAFLSHSQGWTNCQTQRDETFVSLDAKAWSDNFPSKLQFLYLTHKYGKPLAKAWLNLTVKCKWKLGNTSDTVIYGKGQGMGTKGSFVLASVTDHLFIEYIQSINYGKTLPYVKVGDDLVISDPLNVMAAAYQGIGVSINMSKSKIKTKFGHFMEFVSRNSWDGYDYSTISPSLLVKALKQPFYLVVLIRHLAERGCISLPLILNLVRIISNGKKKEEVKILNLLSLFETLSGTPFIEGSPLVGSIDKENMKFILLELLRNLNVKYHEWEKREAAGNSKLLATYGNDYYDIGLSYSKCHTLYFTENSSSLQRIKMVQYLIASNSASDPILSLLDDGCLELSDNGWNDDELALCQSIFKQTVVVESWLSDLKIINKLDLLGPKNSKALLYLMKDLNKLVNKVENEHYCATLVPNVLVTTFMLTSTLNRAFGLEKTEDAHLPEDSDNS
jgi:hypothetical protein